MRSLRQPEIWARAAASFPLVAHWANGEPLESDITAMAGIEDRSRRYVLDGMPVATGVVPVADSWACSNPSVGRGASIGLLHAVALRDLVRDGPLDYPLAFALAWDEVTELVAGPGTRKPSGPTGTGWRRSTPSWQAYPTSHTTTGTNCSRR